MCTTISPPAPGGSLCPPRPPLPPVPTRRPPPVRALPTVLVLLSAPPASESDPRPALCCLHSQHLSCTPLYATRLPAGPPRLRSSFFPLLFTAVHLLTRNMYSTAYSGTIVYEYSAILRVPYSPLCRTVHLHFRQIFACALRDFRCPFLLAPALLSCSALIVSRSVFALRLACSLRSLLCIRPGTSPRRGVLRI